MNTSDPGDARRYRITTNMMAAIAHPQRIVAKDFETLLIEYLRHPESKSLGPDEEPCRGDTFGLLQRMHIIAGKYIRMDKEHPRGIEEGDEPTEIMEFQARIYDEPDEKRPKHKDIVQPTMRHFNQLRQLGYRKLIKAGCSRRFLDKIHHREFMRAVALRDFERAVRKCK